MTSDENDSNKEDKEDLSFLFRKKSVPVSYHPSLSDQAARRALDSEVFRRWVKNISCPCGSREIDVHSVEIQSVDIFGSNEVGFVKIKADCTLLDENNKNGETRLPGICFLRGDGVAILVKMKCVDDDSLWSLLVDQPRIPVGQVSTLELPAGMIHSESGTVAGVAAKEMKEECGIDVDELDLIDLTELAYGSSKGICPSPGGCDEYIRILYLERNVTKAELERMRDRLSGLREDGEIITLRVIPFEEVWSISADMKTTCGLFLLDRLEKSGKLASARRRQCTLSA